MDGKFGIERDFTSREKSRKVGGSNVLRKTQITTLSGLRKEKEIDDMPDIAADYTEL